MQQNNNRHTNETITILWYKIRRSSSRDTFRRNVTTIIYKSCCTELSNILWWFIYFFQSGGTTVLLPHTIAPYIHAWLFVRHCCRCALPTLFSSSFFSIFPKTGCYACDICVRIPVYGKAELHDEGFSSPPKSMRWTTEWKYSVANPRAIIARARYVRFAGRKVSQSFIINIRTIAIL